MDLRNSPGDLELYGFETTPNTDIDANSRAVPELSTWAMMVLGFVGTSCRQAPPVVAPRLTPKARGGATASSRHPRCAGMTEAAHPSISAVTCAATERESPSRS